jgi:hypothetical protein
MGGGGEGGFSTNKMLTFNMLTFEPHKLSQSARFQYDKLLES